MKRNNNKIINQAKQTQGGNMKKIGILTSGGDAPGMNACIRAAVRTALAEGTEVVGIRRGYEGLLHREFVPLDRNAIYNIIHRGGTILETSRSNEFETREGRVKPRKLYTGKKSMAWSWSAVTVRSTAAPCFMRNTA